MLGSRELGGTGEWFLVVLKYLRYTYLTLPITLCAVCSTYYEGKVPYFTTLCI